MLVNVELPPFYSGCSPADYARSRVFAFCALQKTLVAARCCSPLLTSARERIDQVCVFVRSCARLDTRLCVLRTALIDCRVHKYFVACGEKFGVFVD